MFFLALKMDRELCNRLLHSRPLIPRSMTMNPLMDIGFICCCCSSSAYNNEPTALTERNPPLNPFIHCSLFSQASENSFPPYILLIRGLWVVGGSDKEG